MVRQLGNGRAVSGAGRLIRQRLRSTRAHARASTHARAPTVHTPSHISTALHKHDHCTFLHLHADMFTSQRRERARAAAGSTGHGTAGRHRFYDTASRCEAYNHLNKRQQSALQWSCTLFTRALPGLDRRAVACGTPQWCHGDRACPAAAREHAPAPRGSAQRSDCIEDVMLHGPL